MCIYICVWVYVYICPINWFLQDIQTSASDWFLNSTFRIFNAFSFNVIINTDTYLALSNIWTLMQEQPLFYLGWLVFSNLAYCQEIRSPVIHLWGASSEDTFASFHATSYIMMMIYLCTYTYTCIYVLAQTHMWCIETERSPLWMYIILSLW